MQPCAGFDDSQRDLTPSQRESLTDSRLDVVSIDERGISEDEPLSDSRLAPRPLRRGPRCALVLRREVLLHRASNGRACWTPTARLTKGGPLRRGPGTFGAGRCVFEGCTDLHTLRAVLRISRQAFALRQPRTRTLGMAAHHLLREGALT